MGQIVGEMRSHSRSSARTAGRWLGLLLVLLCAAVSLPALAVDKSKVAEAMAVQAGKAFETGDYARAADLYLNAWRTDANSAFLYGAARSQHLAGRTDQAKDSYQQFLTAANADPERQKRAHAVGHFCGGFFRKGQS